MDELKGESEGQRKVDYILGMRLRKSKEVSEEVLRRAGRYRKVADNLLVKEVVVNSHRYVVCHNPEEEERDRRVREEIIERTREEVSKKGAKAFVMPLGLRRFVELVGGELVLKEMVIREESRYDGKWVLRTSTDLPADEVALAYKSLWQIEHAFRELKSGLEVRPVFLRTSCLQAHHAHLFQIRQDVSVTAGAALSLEQTSEGCLHHQSQKAYHDRATHVVFGKMTYHCNWARNYGSQVDRLYAGRGSQTYSRTT